MELSENNNQNELKTNFDLTNKFWNEVYNEYEEYEEYEE